MYIFLYSTYYVIMISSPPPRFDVNSCFKQNVSVSQKEECRRVRCKFGNDSKERESALVVDFLPRFILSYVY